MAPRKSTSDDGEPSVSTVRAASRGTPDSGQDLRLLVRAATMYHLEGLTQAEIASRLGVSRPTAGRLVARARAQGLVRVSVAAPAHLSASIHTDLERAVEETLGLDEVLIIDEVADGTTTGNAALGRAGASVLTRRIQATDTFGFTWGPEQVAVADAMAASASCQRVVQMDGSMTSVEYHTGVDHALGRFSERLGARPVRLVAPLFADPDTVRALERDSIVSQALAAARSAEVMLFGVGSVSTSTTLFEGAYIDTEVLGELHEVGAVGDGAAVRDDHDAVGDRGGQLVLMLQLEDVEERDVARQRRVVQGEDGAEGCRGRQHVPQPVQLRGVEIAVMPAGDSGIQPHEAQAAEIPDAGDRF